jgi:hypothetical protein
MFEEIISALQGMDVTFEEMPEEGMLQIQVNEMDKMQLIEVLNMVTSMGMTVSQLDDATMTVSSGAAAPMQEEAAPEDAQQAALDAALTGM